MPTLTGSMRPNYIIDCSIISSLTVSRLKRQVQKYHGWGQPVGVLNEVSDDFMVVLYLNGGHARNSDAIRAWPRNNILCCVTTATEMFHVTRIFWKNVELCYKTVLQILEIRFNLSKFFTFNFYFNFHINFLFLLIESGTYIWKF